MRCPTCGHLNPPAQRFCGHCGAAIVLGGLGGPAGLAGAAEAETVAGPSPAPQRIAVDAARFVPGQILAGRYRMVSLLGKGGMGEVYRADDLKLGQPVALKFLPRDVEADADRLDRFLNEVRTALRVTHPNVCRVFDIAQIEDRHVLSMEFVDGEDLQSLLRRIGRLPEDKAVEIARQLCAGVAAAHDEGVLHRDLKPANVMIDGRGRAKITDFGLAGATAGIVGAEAQAGTPQYMAPEQFDGRELSVQTDIYSLGLVLYELFTGKRAFEGRTINELKEMHSSTPTSPTAHVATLDPVIERAILRCVDPDPARRPKSASSLAAALPGGDPVEMAIAAGETPSPDMIARSGGGGELKPVFAVAALLGVFVGLGAVWFVQGKTAIWNRVALPKPPAELRVAARAAIAAAGYTPQPSGSAFGFMWDSDYFTGSEAAEASSRWQNLPTVQPVPLWFWYREAPWSMTPFGGHGELSYVNPPFTEYGMVRVRLDPSGNLRMLRVIPQPLASTPGPWPEPDWTPLFIAARYNLSDFSPAEPLWAQPMASDARRAWLQGTLRIEAASMRGKPVSFAVMPEWSSLPVVPADGVGVTVGGVLTLVMTNAVIILVSVGGILIARRNITRGRGDPRGATRFAIAYLSVGIAYELLRLSGNPSSWIDVFVHSVGGQFFFTAVAWLCYVAIEPYVRRLWPRTLVSWSRAIDGRWRDPMVGRDMLLGALAGLVMWLLSALPDLITSVTTAPSEDVDVLRSMGAYLQGAFEVIQVSLLAPVGVLVGVLIIRLICRRPWIAYAVIYLVLGGVAFAAEPWAVWVCRLLIVSIGLVMLTRFGLLAVFVAVLFTAWAKFPLSSDPSSWFFTQSLVTMACFAGVAVYGCWVSIGNQKVFKAPLLE